MTDLGATLLRIVVPDRTGRAANVLVGPGSPDRHPAGGAGGPDARWGATCGRVANRLNGAAYAIDGVRYALDTNEGPNQLHGGSRGFDRRLWSVERCAPDRAEFSLVSENGDQGHPGRLEARATFALEPGCLRVTYEATTDAPTHVNLVAHPYFNLSGEASSVLEHQLRVDADAFLPIDADGVPTGEVASVAGTPFDFRRERAIGTLIDADDPQLRVGDGYNHNLAPGGGGMREVAQLRDPASGRRLSLATDQPGLQLYTANALPQAARRTAVCLETQGWPDAANRPAFPSTRLDPGQRYRSETLFRFDAS